MVNSIVRLPLFVVWLIFLAGIGMGFYSLVVADSYLACIAWAVGGLVAVLLCSLWYIARTLPNLPGD